MSIGDISYSFVNYFLPKEVIQYAEKSNDYETYQILFQYCVKAVEMAYAAFMQGNGKAFDPNPGDANCQARGYIHYRLFSDSQVKADFEAVANCFKNIQQQMCSKRKIAQSAFFKSIFEPITLSSDVAFLLGCFVSATVRVPHHQEANGVVVTQTNIGRLSIFAKKIDAKLSKDMREKMVDHIKLNVCTQSLHYMREQIDKISSVFEKEKPLLQKMYGDGQVKRYSGIKSSSEKPFVCQFFSLQGVIYRIREEQMLVAFKSITKQGKPYHLFYRSKNPGGPLERIEEESVGQMPSDQPVVVYEGVVSSKLSSKEELAKTISEMSFTKILLTGASYYTPFYPNSKIQDIDDQEARQVISKYQQKGVKMGCAADDPIILFDHIYANTIGKELIR